MVKVLINLINFKPKGSIVGLIINDHVMPQRINMVGFYWIRPQLSFKILIRLIGPTSAILDIKDNFEIKTMVKNIQT